MKAKTIKALDAIIAGLEELKGALEIEASKSGGAADDEDTGKVSGSKAPAKAGRVPAKGKPARPAPDDDDDVDDGDSDDADDSDDEDDEEDLPPAKAPVKGKPAAKTAAKPAAKTAAKGKAKGKEVTLDEVKEQLTAVMNNGALGKKAVLGILKKYDATKSAELDESDYAAVVKACAAAIESASADSDDEDEDV